MGVILILDGSADDHASPATTSQTTTLLVNHWRDALARQGRAVEVLVATQARSSIARVLEVMDRVETDLIALVDVSAGYQPADLERLLVVMEAEQTCLVVGSRRRSDDGWLARLTAGGLRLGLGTSDPTSGLMVLRDRTWRSIRLTVSPIGTWFGFELLAKSADVGPWRDVPVAGSPRWLPGDRRPSYEDLRHFKRLADHRFGTYSRLLQFCLVGASGMVIDLSCYALFQWLLKGGRFSRQVTPLLGGPMDLAIAGALAIAIALVWNFSLNRRFTFNDRRHGSIPRQFVTYAMGNALGVALSFTLRITLPRHFGFFADHKLVAALVGIIAATGISFSMARWLVFTRTDGPDPTAADHGSKIDRGSAGPLEIMT